MAAEWKLLMMTTTVLPLPLVWCSSSHPPWSSSASLPSTLFLASTSDPLDDDFVDAVSGNGTMMSTSHYERSNLSSLGATADDVLDDERFPAYISLLMMLSCGLILVVGLVGNCLVPVVIWNNRDLRNSTNLFLLNLSLADILVLCVSMPTVLIEIYERRDTWIFGKVMCKLVPFVELTVAHASVLTILAISFERYYVITRPLRAGYTCTRMRALFIILAIWILGCLTSSPMLFIANYLEEDSAGSSAGCVTQANTFWPIFYFMSAICVFFFFPLIVLVLIYTVIARHLVADPCTASNHRIQVQTSASVAAGTDGVNPNLRARRQVVTMLGTVVVFFFICLLPFRIFTLWFILASDEDIENFGIETYYHVLNFCRVMFYLNSAINPILYNVMSSKFRTAFLKALGFNWAGRRKRLLRHLSRQSTFNTTTTSGTASGTTTSSEHQLIKRMTKEDLLVAANNQRPVMQKYGRQGSCTAASRASSKPLLTVTLSTTSTSMAGNPADSSCDSHV
ncbi:growth hormone secretagogue receptor type 1-like [Daphnia carinata]|uniref:growth hormone secretagogue receptor type 1-like n=1 Tax=Daphnia carinata TaxID=120202 RepID=UPI00257D685B|nr:growth hormone secretagogue receptor type 1-like [Daphnia carinata]